MHVGHVVCDYRGVVANPEAKIGLNETKLGIVSPALMSRQMGDTIGHRKAVGRAKQQTTNLSDR